MLEAAVNGRADALVTCNLRRFVQAAARFRLRLARPEAWAASTGPCTPVSAEAQSLRCMRATDGRFAVTAKTVPPKTVSDGLFGAQELGFKSAG